MAERNGFDPSRYLSKVGTSDYLEVKWRLVWLRETNPDAMIATELVTHDAHNQHAIFKATVTLPSGASASGYGSEDVKGFREYIEKAETKAIGRALAALGFGTQFCDDHAFGEPGRVVDAPVNRPNSHANGELPPRGRTEGHNTMPSNNYPQQQRQQGSGPGDQTATPRQIKFIEAIARDHGIGDEMLDEEILNLYNCTLPELTRRDASAFIERLQSRRNVIEMAS